MSTDRKLCICHVIGIFSPEHGGPAVSCRNYVMAQAERGFSVSLYTVEGYRHTSPAFRMAAPVRQRIGRVAWPEKLGASRALRQQITAASTVDIFHLHGIWLRAMYYGYEKAKRERRPYVIEINGALDPLELATKPWRKRLVRWWFQDRMLHEAPCIHVNSEREARHVRVLGFWAPIAIIPAGFNFDEFDALARQAEASPPIWAKDLTGRRVLLYLSRIHPAKGIDDLLSAWPQVAREFPEWDLVVVGPGDVAGVETRKVRIKAAGMASRCHWIGMVSDVDRAWAFSHANLYVLPSHKENFGNTVQEALGYGTPVVTTRQTPWTELETLGCGWVCDDNPDSLGETLSRALRSSLAELRQMGGKGREIIARDFSLESVVDRQLGVYSWLLGGQKPDCIWAG